MIVKCQECGKDISDQAASCPSCGFPMKTTLRKLSAIVTASHDKLLDNKPIIIAQSGSILRHAGKIGLLLLTIGLIAVPYGILIEIGKNGGGERIIANAIAPFLSWWPFANVLNRLYGAKTKRPLSVIFVIFAGIGVLSEGGFMMNSLDLGRGGAETWTVCIIVKIVSCLVVFDLIRAKASIKETEEIARITNETRLNRYTLAERTLLNTVPWCALPKDLQEKTVKMGDDPYSRGMDSDVPLRWP